MIRRIAVAGAAALAIGGCGGSGHASRRSTLAAGNASPPGPSTVHHGRSASSAASRLQHALRHTLRAAGPASGVLVYDLTAHSTLFSLREGIKRSPASVEKIYTTVALAQELGPNARLQTTVLGAGHLGPGGVWHGDLYLRGGGDPTLGDGAFNKTWELGFGPTAAQLVAQLARRHIRRVTGKVIGDEALFDSRRGGPATGFAPDVSDFGGQLSALTYDHGSTSGKLSPGAFAARELALVMRAAHIPARAAARTATTPRRARPLASVSSPPLPVLLKLMDIPSDDLFAELLTKQLGVRFGTAGSISDGARVIADVIATYGLHPKIVDGSGLSRDDRSSPREVVELLAQLWHTPPGRLLSASLPVVGMTGTVRRIGVGTAAQGRCIGKTGTLNYVTNLAGYCHSRGGRMLAFALFLDGPTNARAMVLISRMTAAIARY